MVVQLFVARHNHNDWSSANVRFSLTFEQIDTLALPWVGSTTFAYFGNLKDRKAERLHDDI